MTWYSKSPGLDHYSSVTSLGFSGKKKIYPFGIDVYTLRPGYGRFDLRKMKKKVRQASKGERLVIDHTLPKSG